MIATVGLDRQRRRSGPGCSPAASGAGSTSRSASSAGPSCCSSTSPPPGSTRRPGASSGTWSRTSPGEGTTILLTTHYLEEAERLADRVAVIAAGAIIEVATPADAGRATARRGHGVLDRPGRRAGASVRTAEPTRDGHRAGRGVSAARSRTCRSAARRSRTSTSRWSGCRDDADARLDRTTTPTGCPAPGRSACAGCASSCCSSPATARPRSSRMLLPVLLLVVFGSAFTGDVAPGHPVQPVLPRRDDRLRHRLHVVPEPRDRHPAGAGRRHAEAAAGHTDAEGRRTSSARSAWSWSSTSSRSSLMMAIGVTLFDVHLPSEPADWWTFTWVSVLGLLCCTLLGVAFSVGAAQRARRVGPGVPVVLVLQFTSGVFFQYDELPPWMQQMAALFPLKWLCQGMRSVFLPDSLPAPGAGRVVGARADRAGPDPLVGGRPGAGAAVLPVPAPRRHLRRGQARSWARRARPRRSGR